MAYGTIKADTFIYDDSGDQTLTLSAVALTTGATFTGDVVLNAQKDLRFADADSSNYVAFQAHLQQLEAMLFGLCQQQMELLGNSFLQTDRGGFHGLMQPMLQQGV